MALLKTKDLRAMRPEDLRAKLKEINDELMHERGVAAMGGAPASPGKIRALRSNVARMHTIILEQDRASGAVPQKREKKKSAKKKEEKK
jgi:large subunit ribosomal protein L29